MKGELKRLERGVTVRDLDVSEKNNQFIERFLQYMQNHVVPQRLEKYRYALSRIADIAEKDFDTITKEDSRAIAGVIAQSGAFTAATKEDILSDTRRAFRYLFGDDEECPACAKPLRLPRNQQQKGILRLPKKVLSEEQTLQLIKATDRSRDKFFIALLGLDGGIRPCEAYRMKWEDIERDEHGYFATIKTAKKSGDKETRVIRLIKSEPYFIRWCNDYPKEKKGYDPVFITPNFNPIDQGTTHALFKRLKKRLKWEGRLYPYLFRHSVLTRMSKNPTIALAVLKKFAGHAQSSNTIVEYQHIGDDDLRTMQLQINGVKPTERKEVELTAKPIICSKCQCPNEYDAEFCYSCNFALSQKRVVQAFDDREKLETALTQIKQQREEMNKILYELSKEKLKEI